MQIKLHPYSCIIILLVFLLVGFFYLQANKTLAVNLEVEYPTISGQTLGADTKLPDYVLYLFKAGVFLGFFSVFISLVIAGVMYLLSPAKPDLMADAKDRISGAISGLLILALTYLIITTINPQLSVFNFNPPEVAPPPDIIEQKTAGIYFYNGDNCPTTENPQPNTSGLQDLGPLKNKLRSVGIIKDVNSQYVSILYDTINFRGRCLYLDPNKDCQPTVDPVTNGAFASSASVYKYDPNPNGNGVYFYRKSNYNDKAGYYVVPNSKIKGIRIEKLSDLCFTGSEQKTCATMNPEGKDCTVPKEEQDCIKYEKDGTCKDENRKCPSLAGENISSMWVRGDYIVLFVYFSPTDKPDGIWTSCQEFPTIADVNKLGPAQIKWESIRNNSGVVPNYVVIIPIQR